MLAAAEQRLEFGALDLAEFDPIAYIHACLPERHERTTESDGRRESFGKNFHAQAGAIPRLHPPLYEASPKASGGSRHAGIFPHQSAFGSPNGAIA